MTTKKVKNISNKIIISKMENKVIKEKCKNWCSDCKAFDWAHCTEKYQVDKPIENKPINREELKERLKNALYPSDDSSVESVLYITEQYAASQTVDLKKQIDNLRNSLKDMLELYISSHEEDENRQLSLSRSMEILSKVQKILTT